MGQKLEFNWYMVVKDNNLTIEAMDQGNASIQKGLLVNRDVYTIVKDDYRIYPMHTPIPLLYNGICLGMVEVVELAWAGNSTILIAKPVLIFAADDPTAQFYEASFREYKREQEAHDDGGKVDLDHLVTPVQRTRLKSGV